MSKSSRFVSVVAIMHNDGPWIEDVVTTTIRVLKAHYEHYELVLVDDGSTDSTLTVIDQILARHECIRLIPLSQHFGMDAAVTAGLDSAIGDLAVVMRAAFDPPEIIPQLVACSEQGFDIVIGTCANRGGSWFSRWAKKLFFRVFRQLTDSALPVNAATMRLFSRQALNVLTRIRQKRRQYRLLGCSVGFRIGTVEYQPLARSGEPFSRSWRSAIGEGISILLTNTPVPLRLISYVGGIGSAVNFLYVLYIIGVNVFKDQVAEGWTTLSLQLSFMFLFTCSTLVLIAEYLLYTFEEVQDRPLYYVADEKTSSTAVTDAMKRNVAYQSTDVMPDDFQEARHAA